MVEYAPRGTPRVLICPIALTLFDDPRENSNRAQNKRAEDKVVAVILILAMLLTFLVVGRYIHKKAEARKVRPIAAGYEVPENIRFHQVRAGVDRRQANRRVRVNQSPA
jgi:hypothetical protein